MAFDVEAAKADGYSDEEIQQYLATKDQPLPADQPRDRSEEQLGVAQASIPETAKIAAEVGLAGYGIKKLGDVIRGPVAPGSVPATPPGATQRIMQSAIGNPSVVNMPATSVPNPAVSPSYAAPSAPAPQAVPAARPSMMNQASDVVRKLALDKVLKNAGVIGAGMSMAQGLFDTSPDEIAVMKAAEAKKRAQGWKPMNER